MVNVKDPADIARKVKILIQDKNMTSSIVKNSLEMVGEKYDWDYITSDMKRDVLV
jgi:glycosyltransferase involved in cell wall biosynthesis